MAGRSTLNQIVWLHERRLRSEVETHVAVEEAPCWDTKEMELTYKDRNWRLQFSQICPSIFGWPVVRPRTWGVASNNSKVRMTTTLDDFVNCFRRVGVVDADCLYCESLAHSDAALQREARRGIGLAGKMAWDTHGLTAPQMIRLQEYRRLHADRVQRGAATDPETQIFDLDQNAIERGRTASHGKLPTILRHNTLWSEAWGRPLLMQEAFGAMGWQTCPSAHGGEFAPPWLPSLSTMRPEDGWQLVGNSMHLHIAMVVAAYIIACSEDVPAQSGEAPHSSASVAKDSDDDDECPFVSAVQRQRVEFAGA